MAALTPAFLADTERIHNEHQILEHVLQELDSALDRLVCYGEVFADFHSAGDVHGYGRQLIDQFPEHCAREEESLFKPVSDVSPELADFCNKMRSQHGDLLVRLAAFRAALDAFDGADDLSEAIYQLTEKGKALTGELRRHVAAEEHELRGFL